MDIFYSKAFAKFLPAVSARNDDEAMAKESRHTKLLTFSATLLLRFAFVCRGIIRCFKSASERDTLIHSATGVGFFVHLGCS